MAATSRFPIYAGTAILVSFLLVVSVHAALVLNASPLEPVRADTLAPDGASVPTEDDLALARRYAPWILHETDTRLGRQDIPAAMDFDGDRDGTNAWENMPRHELLPTVYYTVVETRTHWFLTYHVYHPRAWSNVDLGLGRVHEGDGANAQVVVDKATQDIVLLTTQAAGTASSVASSLGPKSGRETLRADFEVVTGHPSVYIERGTHGIYGSRDPRAANRLARIGEPVVAYRPAEEGERVAEPSAPWNETVPYRLVSLPAFLNNSTDHPSLFADFEDNGSPRYHHGDRYAGWGGASRGASPFALGFRADDRGFDALFWHPAESYQEAFVITGDWSTEYVAHLFRQLLSG